jgi:mRNA interferase MazF
VVQPDWLALSTSIVAFTSTSARPTSFRPSGVIADRDTLVMCDQLATVDLHHLEQAGFLTRDEMHRVEEAIARCLTSSKAPDSGPNTEAPPSSKNDSAGLLGRPT